MSDGAGWKVKMYSIVKKDNVKIRMCWAQSTHKKHILLFPMEVNPKLLI